jgi:hypothetical protein
MNDSQAVGLTNNRAVIAEQALANARAERSFANYPAIVNGFIEKGIPVDDITPRVNVFTYNAWLALGRQVRAGEKGVKIVTVVAAKGKRSDDNEGANKGFNMPRTVAVFHVSQTDPVLA